MAVIPEPLFLPDGETIPLHPQFVSLGEEWLPRARAALMGEELEDELR